MQYSGSAFRIERLDHGIVKLVFDLDSESVNKFNRLALHELGEAVRELAAHGNEVRGLLLTSAKKVFVVGADITEFIDWFRETDDVLAGLLRQIHTTFSALEDLPFPTVAVINGYALGGGFEVALCTDYRVMSTTARVGLPEVKLGIFPGWGGTIRLPRIIGLDNALEWIGTGSEKRADEALRQGAVDAVLDPGQLERGALSILQQCIEGKLDYRARRREKREPVRLGATERAMVFATARGVIEEKAGPHYPAPGIALECAEKNCVLDRDAAVDSEVEGFIRAARTEVAGNLIGLFLNDQFIKKAVKSLTRDARPVRRAGVLGAGVMGGGIAYQAAVKGVSVVMKDIKPEALQLGLGEARKQLAKRAERGYMDAAQVAEVLARIDPALGYGELEGVDTVIEAVVENRKVKETVLCEVEDAVSGATIITSNTSTLSISELGRVLRAPERFCGMHFFNPVPVMPLVEVIRGEASSDATIAATTAFAAAIGKNPIVVKDCPGFLVNRVLFPYLNAFNALVHDGVDVYRIDAAMERFGWPMGPAYLLDVIGMDIACHAGEVLSAAYPDRMRPGYRTATEQLYAGHRLGQKSGKGFYRYEPDRKGRPAKHVDETLGQLLTASPDPAAPLSEDDIVVRMMIPMCLEAVRCLEEGIVDSPVAVDMGLIWGIGFPPFRGGALCYMESRGLDQFCALADRYAHLGPAYKPTGRLYEMARKGESFFGAR